jgi:phosphate/sulfate permease
MTASPLIDFIAREHPAFVHIPLGLVAVLPVAMLASFYPKHGRILAGTSFFIAVIGWLGSTAALVSGLIWGRQINLIGPSAYLPLVVNDRQVLQKILQIHVLAAVAGFIIGGICVLLLWRIWRHDLRTASDGPEHRHHPGRRFWERGVGAPALLVGFLWLGCWGFSGKLGGIMVFGNEETNRAAAEADRAKRNDVEADLPIRALDYASLEPAESAPARSKAHGDRWRRVWVSASGIDAYKAGNPLPPGAYAVMSTFTDTKGKPSTEPGPLYMKETKADGTTAFTFYWARVPEALQKEFGNQDSAYWRSPDPKLATCLGCHEKGAAIAAK